MCPSKNACTNFHYSLQAHAYQLQLGSYPIERYIHHTLLSAGTLYLTKDGLLTVNERCEALSLILACIFWRRSTTTKATVRSHLDKIQSLACLSMTNTPLRAMEVFLDLPPLDGCFHPRGSCSDCYSRLRAVGCWAGSGTIGHLSILETGVVRDLIFSMISDALRTNWTGVLQCLYLKGTLGYKGCLGRLRQASGLQMAHGLIVHRSSSMWWEYRTWRNRDDLLG